MIRTINSKFQTNRPIDDSWVFLRAFNESLEEALTNCARALPDRLKGKYRPLTAGVNLFNWDDVLTSTL